MNRESSRSHAVFTLTIESKRKVGGGRRGEGGLVLSCHSCNPSKETANGAAKIRTSLLNLVDLAGSERQRDTNTVGLRLKVRRPVAPDYAICLGVSTGNVLYRGWRSAHPRRPLELMCGLFV